MPAPAHGRRAEGSEPRRIERGRLISASRQSRPFSARSANHDSGHLPGTLKGVCAQANGYRVTLLFVEETEAEDRDEEEALEASWRVGFGRRA